MRTCVFPGSFDPVTRGHMDLIERAAALFDRVTVTVMINRNKQGSFPVSKRKELLEKACAGLDNVTVDLWDGLLVDYLRARGENTVIRGVRNTSDFEAESISAQANRMLFPEMETVILFAGEGKNAISSSAVREIASFGGSVAEFIPEKVADEINAFFGLKD